jgi:preprotein translocase subunit SecE
MGRLLRKKDTNRKLKKKPSAEEAGQEQSQSVEPESSPAAVKKSYTPVGKPAVVKEKTQIDKAMQFLREVKVELKKVTWPTRKQTMGSTVVVLVIVTIISIFLGIVDAGLSGLIRAVLQ